jgi:hypothetical protein
LETNLYGITEAPSRHISTLFSSAKGSRSSSFFLLSTPSLVRQAGFLTIARGLFVIVVNKFGFVPLYF